MNYAQDICIDHVFHSYGQRKVIVDLCLSVNKSEWMCLLGANGSGKSTLIDLIVGARRPTSGSISILGRSPSDQEVKRRRGVQLERPVYAHYAKVKEIVWLISGFYSEPIDAYDLLRQFRLDPNIYIRHLSKGKRQALAVVLALTGRPDLLVLDEPTSGLDPEMRALLWSIISSNCGDRQSTVFFTTHDMLEAERYATRVAILHKGRILALDTPKNLRDRVIGATRKVTIKTDNGSLSSLVDGVRGHIAGFSHLGAELALYTDDPRDVLNRIPISDCPQVRIESVSLEDVFIKLTREEAANDVHTVARNQ